MRRTLLAIALFAGPLVAPVPASAAKAKRCPYGPAPTLVATPTPPCRAVPLP